MLPGKAVPQEVEDIVLDVHHAANDGVVLTEYLQQRALFGPVPDMSTWRYDRRIAVLDFRRWQVHVIVETINLPFVVAELITITVPAYEPEIVAPGRQPERLFYLWPGRRKRQSLSLIHI